jgi:tetratricopeptide (TPR) repeat protein
MVRCPQCGSQFLTGRTPAARTEPPAIPLDLALPSVGGTFSGPRGLPWVIVGAILIAGAIVAGAVFVALQRPQAAASREQMEADLAQARLILAQAEKERQDLRARTEDLERQLSVEERSRKAETGASTPVPEGPNPRKADYDRFMDQGKEALADKRYAVAVRAFTSALQALPGDSAAAQAFADAQKALDADEVEKKRLAEYRTHIEAAQAAMSAQRYGDAVREYLAAQRVLPNDPAAVQGQAAAEKQLANVQDLDKRKAEFTRLMERGQDARKNRRFEEALQAFEAAGRLFSSEREPVQAAAEVRKLRDEARADYNRLMTQGDLALRAQRIEEAIRSFQEAAKVLPGDEAAAKALRTAEGFLNDVQAARVAYFRFMDQGTAALRNGRSLEAVRCFAEALRLVPGDVDATRGLAEAQAAADQDARRLKDFTRLLDVANRALRARQWGDAIKAFNDALNLYPDDPQAAAGLSKARYGQAMADGQAALVAKRYADAITAFEKALAEVPGDLTASTLLRQARALNKSGSGR